MRNRAGPVNCCIAKLLLEQHSIKTITPTELGRMMGVSPTAAGVILQRLKWRRERAGSGRAVYHYDGQEAMFTGQAMAAARKRLARRVVEVLA